jgi:hypothetical protein
MKFRQDYVTNSSSASYVICFARVADMEKARPIIEEYNLDLLSIDDVKHEMRWGELGADWAGACLYGTNKILEANPDDKYVILEECNDAYTEYSEEYDEYDTIYSYDFAINDAIYNITEENGFADIEVAEGEGRNG